MRRILIVEDDPDLRELLSYELAQEGFGIDATGLRRRGSAAVPAADARPGAARSDAARLLGARDLPRAPPLARDRGRADHLPHRVRRRRRPHPGAGGRRRRLRLEAVPDARADAADPGAAAADRSARRPRRRRWSPIAWCGASSCASGRASPPTTWAAPSGTRRARSGARSWRGSRATCRRSSCRACARRSTAASARSAAHRSGFGSDPPGPRRRADAGRDRRVTRPRSSPRPYAGWRRLRCSPR